MKPEPADRCEDFEQALHEAGRSPQRYVLRLYVTGSTPRSSKAIRNIRALCEEHLRGRYDLEVVDIYQQPPTACSEQIIAAPTLIKRLPRPLRRLVGNLSDREKLVVALSLGPDSTEKKGIAHEKEKPTAGRPENKAGSS